MRRLRFRGYGPVWGLAGSMVVLVALILVWGIDRSGPDTTPPAPVVTSEARTIAWEGGECLDLERWTGSHWDRIAYGNFNDASNEIWGPPTKGERFCQPVGVAGHVLLPAATTPGTSVSAILDYGRTAWSSSTAPSDESYKRSAM